MTEMYLRQPGCTCNGYWRLQQANDKEWIQKVKETGYSRYINQNELENVCFQYDTVYENYIDLTRRKISDKMLNYKRFEIA